MPFNGIRFGQAYSLACLFLRHGVNHRPHGPHLHSRSYQKLRLSDGP